MSSVAGSVPSVAALERAWARAPGFIGWLGAVNHKAVGLRFIVTALFFFTLAGLDATVIRLQLAAPNSTLVDEQTFAQLFTTHGSAMMFFFAVPFVEGLGMYFVPLMIGARDMPFPRLNALGYWLFLFGGLLLYFPTLADIANFFLPGDPLPRHIPDGGWFAYPPLTSTAHSPDLGIDFWLIAVTLAEISAIIGAIEIVVSITHTRAPGMTLKRMPLFAWTIFAIAIAILLAFPSIVTGSIMLELERKLALPFFEPATGGHPLLWQHLFWIFGHPEVYIQFLPATGIVSMVLPVFTRRRIYGYTLIVVAVLATALLSLGLWVHHMFATGLPWLGLTIFSASSMMIAIPSGIQVFAWLATLLAARRLTLNPPMLFVLGFLVTFVAGGLTGVMVASVPFDLQVHDTYFVTAHFHYVLVGGVVFPLLAGFYYWFPKLTGRLLSERIGRLVFWLTFIGFNLTFFVQHNLGLLGMRRRVHTFDAGLGWDEMNFVSTLGVFVFGAGLVALLLDGLRSLLRGAQAGANPWRAGTLEWAVPSPPPSFNFQAVPHVRSHEPLWDERTDLIEPPVMAERPADEVLGRETLATSLLDTRPLHAIVLPSDTRLPLMVAMSIALAGFFVIFDLWLLVLASTSAAIGFIGAWMWPASWQIEPPAAGRSLVPVGLPFRVHGPESAPWWGLMLGLGVVGLVVMNLLLSYVFLAVMAPEWPPAGTTAGPLALPAVALVLVLAAALPMWLARRRAPAGPPARQLALLLGGAAALGGLGLAARLGDVASHAPDPTASAYGAITLLLVATQLVTLAVAIGVAALVAMQAARGMFGAPRYMAVDHAGLIWFFVAAVWLVTSVVVQAG
ncbi:MAG TPA: cytochrome c oxidase subunit I [Candidatus Limnocylindria bacterium]|nr:cytochrome c oxidase subunit I [Candidatus Limnocylindria bacterium]